MGLVHALAHIEYNAMKSYLDTMIRFYSTLPSVDLQTKFISEATLISYEESQHFLMLNKRLNSENIEYG